MHGGRSVPLFSWSLLTYYACEASSSKPGLDFCGGGGGIPLKCFHDISLCEFVWSGELAMLARCMHSFTHSSTIYSPPAETSWEWEWQKSNEKASA